MRDFSENDLRRLVCESLELTEDHPEYQLGREECFRKASLLLKEGKREEVEWALRMGLEDYNAKVKNGRNSH